MTLDQAADVDLRTEHQRLRDMNCQQRLDWLERFTHASRFGLFIKVDGHLAAYGAEEAEELFVVAFLKYVGGPEQPALTGGMG